LQRANDDLQKQSSAIAETQTRLTTLQQENETLRRDYKQVKAAADELQARLADIQQTQPPKSPQGAPQNLIALTHGGRQITLNKRGETAGLESLPSSYERAVKDALTTQRVDTQPELAELIGQSRNLVRGTGKGIAFALVSPVGAVVEGDRPTFRW